MLHFEALPSLVHQNTLQTLILGYSKRFLIDIPTKSASMDNCSGSESHPRKSTVCAMAQSFSIPVNLMLPRDKTLPKPH